MQGSGFKPRPKKKNTKLKKKYCVYVFHRLVVTIRRGLWLYLRMVKDDSLSG